MSTQPKTIPTPEDYLALDRSAEIRSEPVNGKMFAMAGESYGAALIINNLSGKLRRRLRGKQCRAISSELRVRTTSGLFTHPDVAIHCGIPEFADRVQDTLDNPVVLFEVKDLSRWLLSEHGASTDVIALQAAQCELPLSEIYEGVSFPAADRSPTPGM